MWALFKGNQTKQSQNMIKTFDKEAGNIPDKQYSKLGLQSIETNLIVGSIGRAHELDENFFYKGRGQNERHKRVESDFLKGKPMQPIQVIKLQYPDKAIQYFVMDGHHRVAIAKKHRLPSINADVTEVTEG